MATHLYRMGTGNGGGDEPTGKLVVTGEAGSVCHALDIDTGIELSPKEFIGNTVTFIVEADKIYEVWMTKEGKESAHVTTDPISQLTTRLSLKYYTAYIDIYCDADAKLSATNGTATFGEGSYRYDGAKFIMTVGEAGTYTITATIEKASVIATGISVVEDSHVTATMPSFGYVKINASSDFETPLQIVCKKESETTIYDTKTYVGTDLNFVFSEAENYVFSAIAKDSKEYSKNVSVVLGSTISATLQTMIEVELTIKSAINDSINITRNDGTALSPCVTDNKGIGTVKIFVSPDGEDITFKSTVAKNTAATDFFEITVTVKADTKEIIMYPKNAMFWYGNEIVVGYSLSKEPWYKNISNRSIVPNISIAASSKSVLAYNKKNGSLKCITVENPTTVNSLAYDYDADYMGVIYGKDGKGQPYYRLCGMSSTSTLKSYINLSLSNINGLFAIWYE